MYILLGNFIINLNLKKKNWNLLELENRKQDVGFQEFFCLLIILTSFYSISLKLGMHLIHKFHLSIQLKQPFFETQ